MQPRDMRLLVTGGLGFIGSNFILRILEKHPDIKITNIDACLHGSNPKNLPKIKSQNYFYVKGNITDKKIVDKLISKSGYFSSVCKIKLLPIKPNPPVTKSLIRRNSFFE